MLIADFRDKAIDLQRAISSQLLHCLTLSFEKPARQFDKAMLIFSIDVDAGSKKLGIINEGRNDAYVHDQYSEYVIGDFEEQALPLFLNLFDSFNIPVTFAVRGQLTEIENSCLNLLLNSAVEHDIGCHGYSHKTFKDLSQKEAEYELEMTSLGMRGLGILPQTFIFPKNQISHLDLLERYGYECYRESGTLLKDSMAIQRIGDLWDIHPSLYLDKNSNVFFLKRILGIALEKRTPLHLWFHLWNFGILIEDTKRKISDFFVPFLNYAKKQEKDGLLRFETMISATKKAKSIEIPVVQG